jgi:drug/metabolite transporter (DMT)-like permease
MLKKQENIGVLFALMSAIIWGVFPVVVNYGIRTIPPITFAAITTLLAACIAFVYAALQGNLNELKNKKTYFPLLIITICIVIIPYILFCIGTSRTSGFNSSMLLLSEIIFTLIFTHFIGEKTTIMKLLGALGVFIGSLFILYNGQIQFNFGDLLVVLSTATYPIGNFYAKKALNLISSSTILFVRFLLGGLFILALSFIVEPQSNIPIIISNNWILILITGFVFFGICKVFAYEALKRLDISKTISLFMTSTLFSLVILIGIYNEIPTLIQWFGVIITAIGVYFSIKRTSVDPAFTKYAP